MKLETIKRVLNTFLVNHIYVGTRCYKIKRKLLNAIGCEIAQGTRVVGPIYNTAKVKIGENCWIGKNFTVNGNGTVVIGDNCDIAPEVTFLTGGHKIGQRERRAGEGEHYNITVSDGSWIGARATIMGNVKIGTGCVVGACACVIEDVDDNLVVGGVPAKVIREIND